MYIWAVIALSFSIFYSSNVLTSESRLYILKLNIKCRESQLMLQMIAMGINLTTLERRLLGLLGRVSQESDKVI